jgi:hypothetical protein
MLNLRFGVVLAVALVVAGVASAAADPPMMEQR